MEQYQGCPNISTRAIESTVESRQEICQENIRIEQEKDPSIQPILQWKRNGIKAGWSTVAPHGRELKVYWYQWATIEIKDEILCTKAIRTHGTGAEYLFIIPVSLRKEIFKHLHEYITGRSKTYDKLKHRAFIGATCTNMFHIGVGFALYVIQENSHQDERKLL